MMTHKLALAMVAALGGVLLAGPALADQQATVTQDTDLHAKPQNGSPVIDTVDQGDIVTLVQCQGNWCYVKHPGPDGWMKKLYLAPANYGPGQTGKDCSFTIGPKGFVVSCDGNSVNLNGPGQPPPPQPNLPYGPDTCKQGYVWRATVPMDHVCVTPQSRATAAQENAVAGSRVDPNGQYGPNSCKQGFVWREAYQGDVVCVTGVRRDEVHQENLDGPSHRVLP